jgi:hypothetical protein
LFALPLILLGACPPILIGALATDKTAGLSSGKVFAISTIGSISAALVIGFVVIERFGVSAHVVLCCFLFVFAVGLCCGAFLKKSFILLLLRCQLR